MNRFQISLALLTVLIVTGKADTKPTPEEWHEYCEMTVHVKVDGWVESKSEKQVTIPINANTLKCKPTVSQDFSGKTWTHVNALLNKAAVISLGNLTGYDAHARLSSHEGQVDDAVACAQVTALIEAAKANGGVLTTIARSEVVRQDWSSEKNTDVKVLERVRFKFTAGPEFTLANSISTRGKFCAQKP